MYPYFPSSLARLPHRSPPPTAGRANNGRKTGRLLPLRRPINAWLHITVHLRCLHGARIATLLCGAIGTAIAASASFSKTAGWLGSNRSSMPCSRLRKTRNPALRLPFSFRTRSGGKMWGRVQKSQLPRLSGSALSARVRTATPTKWLVGGAATKEPFYHPAFLLPQKIRLSQHPMLLVPHLQSCFQN